MINFEEFVKMIEEHNKEHLENEDNIAMIFNVFDTENNGFIEGRYIKKSLLCLTDAPVEDIEGIIQEAEITDEKKIILKGKYCSKVVERRLSAFEEYPLKLFL